MHPLDLMTKEVEHDNHRDHDLDIRSSSNKDLLNDLQEYRELQEEPSSSPWYKYVPPGNASVIKVALRARKVPRAMLSFLGSP